MFDYQFGDYDVSWLVARPHGIGVRRRWRRRFNVNGNSDGRGSHLEFVSLVLGTVIRCRRVYGDVLHFRVGLLGTHLVVVVVMLMLIVLVVTLKSRVENRILIGKGVKREGNGFCFIPHRDETVEHLPPSTFRLLPLYSTPPHSPRLDYSPHHWHCYIPSADWENESSVGAA